jgi:hypothetical protein
VLIDSLHPFVYGNARTQTLAECWGLIRQNWNSPEVARWADGIRTPRRLGTAAVVPYRDADVAVGVPAGAASDRGPSELSPVRGTPPPEPDTSAALAHVSELALARRYRHAAVRWAGEPGGDRVTRVLSTGLVTKLNRTTAMVMDALDGGTPADALERLRERYPTVNRARLERDVLAATRQLTERGIALPIGAVGNPAPAPVADSVSELPAVAAG